jgi:hypothetical protein
MRRFWLIAAAFGLGLCVLAATAAGCGDKREHRVNVIRQHPGREVRGEHEREAKVEHEKHGHEHDKDRKGDRKHD